MNKIKIFATAVLLAFAMLMAGCSESGGPELEMDISDEKNAVITMKNAAKDDFAMAGTLAVAEGEELAIEYELKKGGKVRIELTGVFEGEQSSEDMTGDLPDEIMESVESSYEMTLEDSGSASYEVDPGEYYVEVTVLNTSTGTIRLTAQ